MEPYLANQSAKSNYTESVWKDGRGGGGGGSRETCTFFYHVHKKGKELEKYEELRS